LAIYRELTQRHFHSVTRPTIQDRLEGWTVYRELLDELLDDENSSSSNHSAPPFFLTPEWTFDILHEFVYQFQGFCQFRSAVYASFNKFKQNSATGANIPQHVQDNLHHIANNPDAWAVETVIMYLNKLMQIGSSSKVAGYQYLGVFASVVLSRMECLLGDYDGCLLAADRMSRVMVSAQHLSSSPVNEVSATALVQSVISARLSYAYHAGVAYLMTRRFQACWSILGDACIDLYRGFQTGQYRTVSDLFPKLYDRMLALLAITLHSCPPRNSVDENLIKMIREKHGSQLVKMEEGVASAYESLFVFGSPKFITPTIRSNGGIDNYKLQVRQFHQLMSAQKHSHKLRSYLRLYTSIETQKLAAFYDTSDDDLRSLVISLKHQMRQKEVEGDYKEALDIHYHLNGNMIHVDDAEKQRRFEDYFIKEIRHSLEIQKTLAQTGTALS
jgi:translation initiation factor 3 subunit L